MRFHDPYRELFIVRGVVVDLSWGFQVLAITRDIGLGDSSGSSKRYQILFHTKGSLGALLHERVLFAPAAIIALIHS